jgi:hypothetical protein
MTGKIYKFTYMIILMDVNRMRYTETVHVARYLLLPTKKPLVTFVGKDSPLGWQWGWELN